jgi:hypothetical protein
MKKLLVIFLMLFTSATWAGDYEDGVAAYEQGNYAVAVFKFKKGKRSINPTLAG